MEFHPITLADREWLEPILYHSGQQGSEYTFSNCFNWREIYQIQVAQRGGRALVRTQKGKTSYLFPAGRGELSLAVLALKEDARKGGWPLRLHGISRLAREELETLYPHGFQFEETRESWDYLYLREKLETLAGKKLHGKRNHIRRFLENNRWCYEPISPENLPECFEMNERWCALMGCGENSSLKEEACAVKSALTHFEELGLRGGLLRVEGQVVAFTVGSPVREDTMVIHIEKAFPDIQGAYPMIAQQFVIHACGDFVHLNREDDVGDEGLRRAKLSYQPEAMVEKFMAWERGEQP